MVPSLLLVLLGAAPPANDLSAPFRIRATTISPVRTWTRSVDIEGDASGANVSFSDNELGKDVLRLHRIDAKQVATLLKAVDALPWWSQQDQVSPKSSLGPDQKLELERGATRVELHVAGGCTVPAKKCVPVELIGVLEEWAKKLPETSLRSFAPPERIVFKPQKRIEPKSTPQAAVANPGWDTRRGHRCYPNEKYSVCFVSPFEVGVLSSEAPSVPPGDAVWALETESGLRCWQNEDRTSFTCERADGGAAGGVARLHELNGGLVAETTPDGRWVRVAKTWR